MLARMAGSFCYLKCIKDKAAPLPRHLPSPRGEGGSERSGEPDEVFIFLTKNALIHLISQLSLTASPQGEANCAHSPWGQCATNIDAKFHCGRTVTNFRLSLHLWAARQIRFPPQPRHRDTAITVSAGASDRHKKRPSQSDSGEFFCCCRQQRQPLAMLVEKKSL